MKEYTLQIKNKIGDKNNTINLNKTNWYPGANVLSNSGLMSHLSHIRPDLSL